MRTYWLSGMHFADKSENNGEFIDSDNISSDVLLDDEDIRGHNAAISLRIDTKSNANVEGKFSVADSCIGMDKCMEE